MMEPQTADDSGGSVQQLAHAYADATDGNLWIALTMAVPDGFAAQREAAEHSVDQQRFISRGYIRAIRPDANPPGISR